MDILLKKKDRLEHLLRQLEQRECDRIEYRSRLAKQVDMQRHAIEVLEKDICEAERAFLEKRGKFEMLKNEVARYKKDALVGVRSELEALYRHMFEEASGIRLSTSFSAFAEFTKLRSLMERNVFRGLGKRLLKLYGEGKERLRRRIVEQVEQKLQDKHAVHELMFNMKFLRRYEEYFSEQAMESFLHERMARGFEYHFMSDKDSNRLDKPEWFLDFILAKLRESKEVFDMYMGLGRSGDASEGVAGSFEGVVGKTHELVEMKVDEMSRCSSKQKRSLVLHLGVQVMRFRYEVYEGYGVVLEFPKLGAMLCKEQREYVRQMLARTHGMKHTKWFDGYRELSRDCLLYIHRFRGLDRGFAMDDAMRTIVDYNRVFLESLRYISRQEIRVLCWVYSEFERLKAFLLEQESEIVFDSRLSMQSKTMRVRSSEGMQDMLHDAVLGSLERISEFNSENLKLIMSLARNDAAEALRAMRRFVQDPNGASRSLVADVCRCLEDYRECMSYEAVKQGMKGKIDGFVLEEVILKHKLGSQEYFELVEVIRRLKEEFGDEGWKSEMGCRCVGEVFEGKEDGEGSLFKMVKDLYE